MRASMITSGRREMMIKSSTRRRKHILGAEMFEWGRVKVEMYQLDQSRDMFLYARKAGHLKLAGKVLTGKAVGRTREELG